ncbi:TonB-dependent receptor plug domain-containing protein [Eudoraea chungangensis]|uniref:TonB-dependent receptor plug domain-containing protein n=1 Tax=Eudoraea chungangensis TaxID=1481905 RepID=UPI0023EB1B9E|nr:TonB-dependent receptor plug domain-containing protein [Eudoraea chungangensis]
MKRKLLFSVVLLSLSFTVLKAQRSNIKMVRISGSVTTAEGMPIPKAYVFVDSLKTGSRTNKRGAYKIRIPEETDIISIFSEEYGLESEVYNGQTTLDFKFSANNETFKQSKLIEYGYILDIDVYRNIGVKSYSEYSDIYQVIREKFTGVSVNGTSIVVRGPVSGDQTPLFVVDGNYVDSIDNINVDELKDIELIKGEGAALYGARGASGVLIITLK